MQDDIFYMKSALKLAEKGLGKVSPNPLVGAIIVKNDVIIGQGYHQKYAEPHAEINAFKNCTQDPAGATMYVTLEPCCHHGKTPPCTDTIIANKIKRVVVGALDPNPLVAGKGIDILKQNNIIVDTFVLEEECKAINEVFFHYIKNKTPFVIMKYAMTADGKISTYTGQSKWITGEAAREHVHKTRNNLSAIMVGINTVLHDDPLLTCRLKNGKNPIRVICDSTLRLPLTSNIAKTAKDVPTIIATVSENKQKINMITDLDIKIIKTKNINAKVDLKDLMIQLGAMKIDSVLLEGGAELNYNAIQSGIVNKLHVYIASKILGGDKSLTPVEGIGFKNIDDAFKLKFNKSTLLNEDILLEYIPESL